MKKIIKILDNVIYIFEKIFSILRDRPPMKRLIREGMIVGKNVSVQNGVYFDLSHCWLICIGNNVTFAPHVRIIAHDASTKMFLDFTKIGKVEIGNHVFIGANTTVLPGVKIGDNVIIGANSVITKDIPNNSVFAGNPAKKIYSIEEYLQKEKKLLNSLPVYESSYTRQGMITKDMKKEMVNSLCSRKGYVR